MNNTIIRKAMKSLIVSDLDGTLLNSQKEISAYSINVLNRCKEAGHPVIVATARPPRFALNRLPEAWRDGIIICYNGALVMANEKIIYRKGIPKLEVLAIVEGYQKQGYHQIALEIDDKLYANFDAGNLCGWYPFEQADFESISFKEALKILICQTHPIDGKILNTLPDNCSGILTDRGTLCQIMHKDVSKWNSIVSIQEFLDQREAQVIAFGDDFNDVQMLQNSHHGIAMSNGEEHLKTVANFVAKSNDEDGVAEWLEKNIL